MSQVIHVSDKEFAQFEQQHIQSGKTVLLDFWASWCAPCRALSPILEQLAEELKDELVVAKLNVEENEVTASKFAIRSIPTMILFKDGKPVKTQVGLVNHEQLLQLIKSA